MNVSSLLRVICLYDMLINLINHSNLYFQKWIQLFETEYYKPHSTVLDLLQIIQHKKLTRYVSFVVKKTLIL